MFEFSFNKLIKTMEFTRFQGFNSKIKPRDRHLTIAKHNSENFVGQDSDEENNAQQSYLDQKKQEEAHLKSQQNEAQIIEKELKRQYQEDKSILNLTDIDRKLGIHLENLDFIDCIHSKKYKRWKKVDLSNNHLDEINQINKFQTLVNLKAICNVIQKADLQLNDLTDLDLSNNSISEVPDLQKLPALKRLNLSQNLIKTLDLQICPQNEVNILYLNFAYNEIVFSNQNIKIKRKLNLDENRELDDLGVFIKVLKKFKNLKQLHLDNQRLPQNEMLAKITLKFQSKTKTKPIEESFEQIRLNLPSSVVQFNNAPITVKFSYDRESEQLNTSKAEKALKKMEIIPPFSRLCNLIQDAFNQPSQVMHIVKELEIDVIKISKASPEEINTDFIKIQPDQSDNEKKKYLLQIETFMQNALLIVDSHPKLTQIMLSVLSKLSVVNNDDFSEKCFNTLIDLIYSSKEMEQAVMAVLKREVIAELNNRSEEQATREKIPVSLLKGLKELVKQSKNGSILTDLYQKFFPKFLDVICSDYAIYQDENFTDETPSHLQLTVNKTQLEKIQNNKERLRQKKKDEEERKKVSFKYFESFKKSFSLHFFYLLEN